jgi:acid phosphatase type 7
MKATKVKNALRVGNRLIIGIILSQLINITVIGISELNAQTFLIKPYIQPGNTSSLSREGKIVIWETDSVPGKYSVTYALEGEEKTESATISSTALRLNNKTTLLYRAELRKLRFDADYIYTVFLNDSATHKASFKTRTKGNKTKFAVIGDFAHGSQGQLMIANHFAKRTPDLVVTTGDNVYQRGLRSEYLKKLFPYYNDSVMIMDRIPIYMVVGNHDVSSNNLDTNPDGLAYFYYGDVPINGPIPAIPFPLEGRNEIQNAFRKTTKPRFPGMLNYSFDHGNVHFVCLDANHYVNPLDIELLSWLRDDLQGSKADWKLVFFHQPAFNSSRAHYDDQYMRLLAPVFEQLKVDLVINGHVHNYQRTVPLKFAPQTSTDGKQYVVSKEGRVDGKFTLDIDFDGRKDTTPNGIIYIVTGAGGAPLYDGLQSNQPETWKHDPPSNWVPFTQKLIANVFSYTWIETDGKEFRLEQVDHEGNVIDEIRITK